MRVILRGNFWVNLRANLERKVWSLGQDSEGKFEGYLEGKLLGKLEGNLEGKS